MSFKHVVNADRTLEVKLGLRWGGLRWVRTLVRALVRSLVRALVRNERTSKPEPM